MGLEGEGREGRGRERKWDGRERAKGERERGKEREYTTPAKYIKYTIKESHLISDILIG